MKPAGRSDAAPEAVALYKRLLQAVLEKRPSGMRQRLAEALGKNRSFISQISNPAYPTPIPAQHVDAILEICHFAAGERAQFLAAYRRAHPQRLRVLGQLELRVRRVALTLPDLGDEERNRRLEAALVEMAERIAGMLRESEDETAEGRKP
ncbi:MAG: hypothetical protein U1E53_09015 [Dongiaceae bacterium]